MSQSETIQLTSEDDFEAVRAENPLARIVVTTESGMRMLYEPGQNPRRIGLYAPRRDQE